MKESGSKITWRAWEFISGTTEECIKDNTKMTKSTALVFIHGLMADATKAIGSKASNMGSVHTVFQTSNKLNMVFGKMASVLNGSARTKSNKSMSTNWTTQSSLIRLVAKRWYLIKVSS